MKQLVGAGVLAFVALVFTWIASWLAIDAMHAWKVTTTISAFIFGLAAFVLLMNWVVEGE